MVIPSAGSVVLVPFPFSDLSQSKLRPAVVLANAGRGDWLLCQITSNAYSDSFAVELINADFKTGALREASYARPGKVFTAHQSLFRLEVGQLNTDALTLVIDAVVRLLKDGNS